MSGEESSRSSFSRDFYDPNAEGGGRPPPEGDARGGGLGYKIPSSRKSFKSSRSLLRGSNSTRSSIASVDDQEQNWIEEAAMEGMKNIKEGEDESSPPGFDDEEVLEQYKIMAQHEAAIRVQENTGFDMQEYESRRSAKLAEKLKKKSIYGGGQKVAATKSKPPESIFSAPHKQVAPAPEEPPLPPATRNVVFLQQKQARVPELCQGISVRSSSNHNVPPDEHVVRCLGCRGQLRVKIMATLVGCPECNTVSPASSTRR